MCRLDLKISAFFVDSDLVFFKELFFGETGQVGALLVVYVVIYFDQLTQTLLLLGQSFFLSEPQEQDIMWFLYLLKLSIKW